MGEQHPTVATLLNNLAILLQNTNRFEEAEPLVRRALAIDEASFGERHPAVAIRLNNLATLLHDTNRPAEAEPLLLRAMDILESFRRQTGHEHLYFQSVNENFQLLRRAMESGEPDGWPRRQRIRRLKGEGMRT